jgi:glucose-1-phosphate adenylyltransferase
VDRNCELQDGADVGTPDVALDDPDAIPIIGQDSVVGSALPAGARLPPGTTV